MLLFCAILHTFPVIQKNERDPFWRKKSSLSWTETDSIAGTDKEFSKEMEIVRQ